MFANIELGTIYDDVPTIDPVDYTDVVVDGIVGVLSEYYLTNDNLVRVIDKFHAPCLFLNDINSVAADAASYMFAVDKWSPFKVPNSLLNLYNADEGTTTSITPDCSASYVLLPRQRLVAAMLTAFMVYSVGRSMLMLMPYAVTYGKYALALIPNPSDSVHFLRWTYSFCPHTVHAECDPLDHDHFTAVHWSLRCSPMFQQAMKVVTDPLSCAWGLVLHSSTWSTFGHNLLACAVFAHNRFASAHHRDGWCVAASHKHLAWHIRSLPVAAHLVGSLLISQRRFVHLPQDGFIQGEGRTARLASSAYRGALRVFVVEIPPNDSASAAHV